MNNAPAILRTLIIYAVIVPLAIFVGYMLTDPLTRSTFNFAGILALILVSPVLLRWHHQLLALSWYLGMILFFLPGQPQLYLVMSALSLAILLLHRALGGVKQLVDVPQVTWSLICLVAVVVFTAKMTGLGLRTMGSEVYGGHRYIYLLGAIMGYFALSGHRIPPEKARLYVGLFFLGGLAALIADLAPIVPTPLHFIYLFFPADPYAIQTASGQGGLRFGGAGTASLMVFSYMLAVYGIRGIFLSGRRWRLIVFCFATMLGLLGGFRGGLAFQGMIFALLFYLEGLHRTKLVPIFAFIGFLMLVLLIPLTPHLPFSIQRALSFLPLKVDPLVQQSATGSSTWRFDMWKALLPQVPHYLMLGKGYALSVNDFQLLGGADAAVQVSSDFAENKYMAVAGAYHNGPLSVLMTFGLWGGIAFSWFLIAGTWVLYRNYRYGDPALWTMNAFLLAIFVVRIIAFFFIFGGLDGDMAHFGGLLGLGVSLNGGVCQPVPEPTRENNKLHAFRGIRAHLQPTLRRHQGH